ncbi:14044_t:CDS:2, partial [Gigaspora rosea]
RRDPQRYPHTTCKACGVGEDDDIHWLTCGKNPQPFKTLILETLNEFSTKHEIPISDPVQFIKNLEKSHLEKRIPITVITTHTLLPTTQLHHATSLTPLFYHKLTYKLYEECWLKSRAKINDPVNNNTFNAGNVTTISSTPQTPNPTNTYKELKYYSCPKLESGLLEPDSGSHELCSSEPQTKPGSLESRISIRIEALIEPSLSCDIGGELSPTFLTMNLLVIVIFAFDTIWKNFLRTDSQRFRNFILWSTLFWVSWIASTLGLNRYIPLELWCARRLYMPLTDYINFGIIMTGIISAISLYFQLVNPMKSKDITSSHEKTFISTLFFVYTFQWLCFLFSNLSIILNLDNYSTYQTFFSVILLIGAHSGGIFNSILLSIKQHCDVDPDDEINNIEKNNNPTTLKNWFLLQLKHMEPCINKIIIDNFKY